MNIIQIMGRLGADPETRVTPSGQKVTTLNVATTVRKAGKEETVWWRVTLWGTDFDKMLPYFKKGSSIIVVGEMGKPEIYTNKEGRQQISLNITAEFLRFSPFGKPEGSEGQQQQPRSNTQQYAAAGSQPFQAGSEGFLASASGSLGGANQFAAGYASDHQESEDEQMPF